MELNTSLKDLYKSIALCDKCGVCTFVTKEEVPYDLCPMYVYDKSFTFCPSGLMYTARALIQGNLHYDSSVADFVFSCAGCEACNVRCVPISYPAPHVGPWDVTRLMRGELIDKGIVPQGPMEAISRAVKKDGDLLSNARPKIPVTVTSEKADTVLFAECFHSPGQVAIYESAGRVLEKMGRKVSLFFDGGCCGSSLYDFGFWKELPKLVQSKWEKMEKSKDKSFLFINPHCQEFVAKQYPAIVPESKGVKMQHFSELLAEALKKGMLKGKKASKVKVAYHDPCSLGRGLGIYDAPRAVLAGLSGVELKEMNGNKDASFCCGSRALGKYHPEFSKETAKKGIARFKETGADILITACPYCKQAFQGALSDKDKNKVMDLIEFVEVRTL
jgi:heterodisulfide reductase subunit D